MAKEDAVVQVEDDTVVPVGTDAPEGNEAETNDEVVVSAEPEEKKSERKVERKRLQLTKEQIEGEQPDPEMLAQNLAAAEAARKVEEDKRKAAEATALAERQRAEQAQRQADQYRQQHQSATEQAQAAQLTLIENSITSQQQTIEALEGEIARLYEAGEFAKVASANTKLSRATATLDRLEQQKIALENAPEATTEGRVEAPQNTSMFEQYVSQFAPAAQSWLRAHPECAPAQVGGNAQSNAKMMQGHWDAVGQGLAEGTPEYFRVIEEHAGYRQPTVTADTDAEPVARPAGASKRAAQPSAPVTREPPSSKPLNRNVRDIRLNKDQQDAALISFPANQGETPEAHRKRAFGQYAMNLVALEAEGKMGRLTH